MNCTNCGAQIEQNARFCTVCGAALAAPAQYVPPPQQPVYAPVYAAPVIPKKKARTGIWITLALLLIILGAAGWFLGRLMFFKPKDLGIKYTEADFQSAMDKIGTQITFEGKTGDDLDAFRKSLKDEEFYIEDYNFELTDYQRKSFTLTPQEATALLNEVAKGFWWFEDVQVKVLPDGSMEGSSKADIAKLKKELYSDVAGNIPIPLPDSLNIYSKGKLSITNNHLEAQPEEFDLGPIELPNQYKTQGAVQTVSGYLERIYTVVPELEIISLTADEDGNFVFDGVIPQKVVVTKK